MKRLMGQEYQLVSHSLQPPKSNPVLVLICPVGQVEFLGQQLEARFPHYDISRWGRQGRELGKAWARAFMVQVGFLGLSLDRLNFLSCFHLLIFFLYIGCMQIFIWRHYATREIFSMGSPTFVQIWRDFRPSLLTLKQNLAPWDISLRIKRHYSMQPRLS